MERLKSFLTMRRVNAGSDDAAQHRQHNENNMTALLAKMLPSADTLQQNCII